MMESRLMMLQFLRRGFVMSLRLFAFAHALSDLAAHQVIRKQKERQLDLFNDSGDLFGITLSCEEIVQSHCDTAEDDQAEDPFGRNSECVKGGFCFCRERLRLPISLQREVNFRAI